MKIQVSRDQLWFIRCNFCVWVTKQWQTCPPCPTILAGLRKIITSPPKSLVVFLFGNRGDHNNITPHGTRISSHLAEAFTAESNKSFFYIFVRRFHRNRGWWAQTVLCNGVAFWAIQHHCLRKGCSWSNPPNYSHFPGQATSSAWCYPSVLVTSAAVVREDPVQFLSLSVIQLPN